MQDVHPCLHQNHINTSATCGEAHKSQCSLWINPKHKPYNAIIQLKVSGMSKHQFNNHKSTSSLKSQMARYENCKASNYASKQHGYVSKRVGNVDPENQM